MAADTYPGNNFLHTLFMTLHLEEGSDLANRQVFAVAEGDNLVKGAEQLVCILENLSLVQSPAGAGNNLGKEVERVDVLQDVGLAVGNEHHVELVERLVNESHIVLLNSSMLGAAVGKLGEGCQECLYSGSWHVTELPREDSFPSAGADRSSEDNLVCS